MRPRRIARAGLHQAQGRLRLQRPHRKSEKGSNAAANARTHVATYQTLGLDDEEGFASFLTEYYGQDTFSVIIINVASHAA